jgi:hypothetical protein
MHRRTRPPRETRSEYARRLGAQQRQAAQEREKLAAALAGKPVAMFDVEQPSDQLVLTISNFSGEIVDVRPVIIQVRRITPHGAVWARKTPVRQGRAAGRARRSRSTSCKSSPDGSSSDGEPSQRLAAVGRRRVVRAAGGAR